VFRTGEKVGLVGRNGTGKTTFLNLLTKLLQPDGGKVVVGETVSFGYFSQQMAPPKEGLRLLECVREVADFIPLTKGKTITAAQMLERFMFPRTVHSTYVEKLSGGERKRLQLLLVLMKNPNFLILDEPTNDLDVFTLAALEDYLLQFPGCLVIVSHDRYFLDKLVDHVFVLDGRGNVRDIIGSYSTCRAVMNEMEKNIRVVKDTRPDPVAVEADKKEKTKLSYKEKLEWENLEKEIPELEAEKQQLEQKMHGAYSDHSELMKITQRLGEVISALDHKTNRWLELSEFVK
jgi:ABC transport system ATP-binding/permease protein